MQATDDFSDNHYDESKNCCRTTGCDANPDDGEGWDGFCGNCADVLFRDSPDKLDGLIRVRWCVQSCWRTTEQHALVGWMGGYRCAARPTTQAYHSSS